MNEFITKIKLLSKKYRLDEGYLIDYIYSDLKDKDTALILSYVKWLQNKYKRSINLLGGGTWTLGCNERSCPLCAVHGNSFSKISYRCNSCPLVSCCTETDFKTGNKLNHWTEIQYNNNKRVLIKKLEEFICKIKPIKHRALINKTEKILKKLVKD
ncbi:MAG: hypothetical protein WC783_00405 [Candidatus Paceibacterota bacterium]|jgi:hypothetical protein